MRTEEFLYRLEVDVIDEFIYHYYARQLVNEIRYVNPDSTDYRYSYDEAAKTHNYESLSQGITVVLTNEIVSEKRIETEPSGWAIETKCKGYITFLDDTMGKMIAINCVEFPPYVADYINENVNLLIDGVEFPLSVLTDSNWEGIEMGEDWLILTTKDIDGNEFTIEHIMFLGKFNIVEPMSTEEIKKLAVSGAFRIDPDNSLYIEAMKELKARLTPDEFETFLKTHKFWSN